MYYPSSENKGADQLRSYCEADLRLCFRLCKLLVFPRGGSIVDRKIGQVDTTLMWLAVSLSIGFAMVPLLYELLFNYCYEEDAYEARHEKTNKCGFRTSLT